MDVDRAAAPRRLVDRGGYVEPVPIGTDAQQQHKSLRTAIRVV